MPDGHQALENLLSEDRLFPPSPEFTATANAQPGIHETAEADWQGFWRDQALERITWFSEPTVTLDDSNPPFFKWFTDGELNLAHNCLDRHLAAGGDKVAYHWVGEPGDTRTITYADLHAEVGRFANALKSLGVAKGDRVAIYLGMIPELPVAMLACARIGAVHSVVFGGFSSDSLADRIDDAQAKVAGDLRRSLATGRRRASEGGGRRRRGPLPVDRARRRGAADRQRHRDGRGPRPLVPRPGPRPAGRVPRRADERRGPAVHPLHLGHHRPAQGDRPHPGRLPAGHDGHPPLRVRHQARRRVLVRGRHRLGDRPLLHRVRRRWPTTPPASSTRAPPTTPTSTGCGASSPSTGSPSSTRRRPRSGRS